MRRTFDFVCDDDDDDMSVVAVVMNYDGMFVETHARNVVAASTCYSYGRFVDYNDHYRKYVM